MLISTVADMYLIRIKGCGGGNVCWRVRHFVAGAIILPWSTDASLLTAVQAVIEVIDGSGRRFSALSGLSGLSSPSEIKEGLL